MKGIVFLMLWFMLEMVVVHASSSESTERQLDQTPTWAVAAICAVFIIISVLLEKLLHKLGTWLWDKHKRALLEALDKVKSELMVLGFLSLLLAFAQTYILQICIPSTLAKTWLPCPADKEKKDADEHRRRLLSVERRFLSSSESTVKCSDHYEALISADGLHELHLLIFFLAVFHVLYSLVTMLLGRLKIRGWKKWEQETKSHDYEFSNDPSRFRLTHETSFVRAHTSFWTRIPFFFYIGCFFRQFFRSVGHADYLTLRNGFISVHLAPGSKFDFQKYIKRSLEDDFKVVVGVSPLLWTSFVLFLLLNVSGWFVLMWASLIPVIIILAVGTKLQGILTKMALEISERHAVVQGIPLVQGSDKYFWFGKPQFILHLIHFALFLNAFQITYFLWILYAFGLKSCFQSDMTFGLIKIAIGVCALCLCSYITLPLYALVTQMGSTMKKSIFDEQTTQALKRWRNAAVKKNPHNKKGGKTKSTRTLGGDGTSPTASSGPSLLRYKTTGHSTRSRTYTDDDVSDVEADPLTPTTSRDSFLVKVDDYHDHDDIEANEIHHEDNTNKSKEFSFVKPTPPK